MGPRTESKVYTAAYLLVWVLHLYTPQNSPLLQSSWSGGDIANTKQKSLGLQYNDRQALSAAGRMTQTGTGLERHPAQQEAAKITGGGEMKVGQPIEANGRQSQY